jgi:DNA repair protein RecO (recombination protein O)
MNQIEAIILYSIDYKETGKLVYFYTEEGNKSMQVYGVKKMNSKYRYLVQNGTLVSLSTTNKTFPSLKEATLLNDYEHIKQDLIGYTTMNHILELVRNTIAEENDHKKMFHFLKKVFAKMNQENKYYELLYIYELKLLHFLGYGLNFRSCSHCDMNNELVFHPSSGGLVCKEHLSFNQEYYTNDVINSLKTLYFIDLDQQEVPSIEAKMANTIRHIIDLMYDEFISFHSKSLTILKQL